jgi:UDP-N-acetylglucosamine 1-carboxyvinyltransferase
VEKFVIEGGVPLSDPLLARFRRAVMPPPGGDVIGRRRLDPHVP